MISHVIDTRGLSLTSKLTLQREAVYQRLQSLPERSDRAIALRAQLRLLTNELLACEPAVKRNMGGAV